MSLTPQERSQILYLYHVEAISIVLIAQMTGLSFSTLQRVVQRTSRKDVSVVEKAAAMRPSSKGRRERQIPILRNALPPSSTAVAQKPPPGRRPRKERRHDRT